MMAPQILISNTPDAPTLQQQQQLEDIPQKLKAPKLKYCTAQQLPPAKPHLKTKSMNLHIKIMRQQLGIKIISQNWSKDGRISRNLAKHQRQNYLKKKPSEQQSETNLQKQTNPGKEDRSSSKSLHSMSFKNLSLKIQNLHRNFKSPSNRRSNSSKGFRFSQIIIIHRGKGFRLCQSHHHYP